MGHNADDSKLLARVVSLGDKAAFGMLVERYQAGVRRFFLGQTLGNSPLSDDLAQDTFVKAWLHIGSFKGLSSFQTWLYRIAYNVYYDYTRRNKITNDLDSVRKKVNDGDTDSGLKLDLINALAQLKDVERTCITLQLMEGQPIEQIANIMGIAEGTVKSHLSRGKTKLTTYLKENGYGRK